MGRRLVIVLFPFRLGVTSSSCLLRHCDVTQTRAVHLSPPPLPRHQAVLRAAAVLCVILIAYGRSHYVPSGGSHFALPFICLFDRLLFWFYCHAVLTEHVPGFLSSSSKTLGPCGTLLVPNLLFGITLTSNILHSDQLTALLN